MLLFMRERTGGDDSLLEERVREHVEKEGDVGLHAADARLLQKMARSEKDGNQRAGSPVGWT